MLDKVMVNKLSDGISTSDSRLNLWLFSLELNKKKIILN